MGWLWTSKEDPSNAQTPSESTPSPEPSESSTDAELRAFLESAQTPSTPQPPSSPHQSQSTPQEPPSSSSSSPTSSSSDLITPTTTLPSTLCCRAAFDAAFYCQSFGGQFVNVYRYGSLRGCSEHWADFWFCMRTNRGFLNEEQRREKVRAWALNKEREKYGSGEGKAEADGAGREKGLEKGSSEDVWEKRRRKLRGAFGADWGALETKGRERAESEPQEFQKEQ